MPYHTSRPALLWREAEVWAPNGSVTTYYCTYGLVVRRFRKLTVSCAACLYLYEDLKSPF